MGRPGAGSLGKGAGVRSLSWVEQTASLRGEGGGLPPAPLRYTAPRSGAASYEGPVPTCCVPWSKHGIFPYPDFPTSRMGSCRVSGLLGGGAGGSSEQPGLEGRPGLSLLCTGPRATIRDFLR